MRAESVDPLPDLAKLETWLPYLEAGNETAAHRDHFFRVACPKITRGMLRRTFPSQEAVPRVAAWFREMIRVATQRLDGRTPEMVEMLADLFDPQAAFYLVYGHGAGEAEEDGGGAQPELWRDELFPGANVDIEIEPGSWSTGTSPPLAAAAAWRALTQSFTAIQRRAGMVSDMSPTQTEVEVQFMDGATPRARWFPLDSPQLAPPGQGPTAAAKREEETGDIAEDEALAPWRLRVGLGTQVDARDQSGSWYRVRPACLPLAPAGQLCLTQHPRNPTFHSRSLW